MDLKTAVNKTNDTFYVKGLECCPWDDLHEETVKNLNTAHYGTHYSSHLGRAIFDYRCDKLNRSGLYQMKLEDVVRGLLTKQTDNPIKTGWGGVIEGDVFVPYAFAPDIHLNKDTRNQFSARDLVRADKRFSAQYFSRIYTPRRHSIITHGLLAMFHKPAWEFTQRPRKCMLPGWLYHRVIAVEEKCLFNSIITVDGRKEGRNFGESTGAVLGVVAEKISFIKTSPEGDHVGCNMASGRQAHYLIGTW